MGQPSRAQLRRGCRLALLVSTLVGLPGRVRNEPLYGADVTTTALVLALLALVVSVLSLGWQVVTWRAGGPRIVVTPSAFHLAGHPEDAEILVVVANKGRAPVEVDGCYVALGAASNNVSTYEVPLAPEGKRRLDSMSSLVYQIPAKAVRDVFDAESYRDFWVHGVARLSTGGTVFSNKPVPFPE
jgi:hypothetical protein